MKYIALYDIIDGVLDVTEDDILEAEGYIENSAQRLGVALEDIPTPLPFKARRLAVCYACYNNCMRNIGRDATVNFENGNSEDIFAKKLEIYRQEIQSINQTLSAFDFTGKGTGGVTIRLERA